MEGFAGMASVTRSSRGLIAAAVSAALLIASPSAALRSAHAKIERIEYDRAQPGSQITLSASELLAYSMEQAAIIAPGAIHNATLQLAAGSIETTAQINFLKVRQAEGHQDYWVVREMLDGERTVRIRARLRSEHGRARVDIEQVQISGVSMQGDTLDFLLRQFVIPNFPDAQVGRWFSLGHRIDRIDVETGAVLVAIGR